MRRQPMRRVVTVLALAILTACDGGVVTAPLVNPTLTPDPTPDPTPDLGPDVPTVLAELAAEGREMGRRAVEAPMPAGPMLQDFHCAYVIVGHSERRALHAESDQLVAEKAQAALGSAVTPIVCVGETLAREGAVTDAGGYKTLRIFKKK